MLYNFEAELIINLIGYPERTTAGAQLKNMSYQVLSRKWRPQRFSEIAGQLHVTQTLQNAILKERVGHGYIFSGPRGVGKTSTARVFAKALNCINSSNEISCNKCSNCLEIKDGRSLDVLELDGASNRGIDEIRDLREAVKYPPHNSKYRVYIIDEVHMLTKEAFNALLKTLEEPPDHVSFILATTDPHKIPPTILSRTQRFDFKSISKNIIESHLINIVSKENIKYDKDALTLIAIKASGSLRDSLSMLDQVIAYSQDILSVDVVREILGIIKEQVFLEILKKIESKDALGVINQVHSLIDSGYAIENIVYGFNDFVNNCMLISVKIKNTFLDNETINWVKNNASFSTKDYLRILDISIKFESKLRFLYQPKTSLELLIIKLCSMDKTVEITDLLYSKKNIISTKINNKPIVIKDSSKNLNLDDKKTKFKDENLQKEGSSDIIKKEPASIIKLNDIDKVWPKVMDELEKTNIKVANFLGESNLIDFDNNTLNIELINSHDFHLKILEKDKKILELILEQQLKKTIKVQYQLKNIENQDKNLEDRKQIQDHPLIEETIKQFEGKIIR